MRSILILDMSYTLKMFRERQLDRALESRKLKGFFDKVISVHPLAGLFESGDARFGDPVVTRLDCSHVFVEGKVGLRPVGKIFAPVNFVLAQVRLLRILCRMAREADVGVVRVGDPYYLGLMGSCLAGILGVPLAIRVCFRYDEIFRVTGKPVMPRLFGFRWVEKIVERFVFKRCDLIAGANEDNMRYAIENGGRVEVATVFRYGNLIHAHHWILPEKRAGADQKLEELGLRTEVFVAIVARLEPMKCVEDFIRVVAELLRRGFRVKGLVVGDGLLKESLMALAVDLGAGQAVVFAGNRSQEWIASVLPRAAAVVSPHMGRALTEAALAGVPVVAYDYDWQREVVVDGETGFLVANHDWMGLADKTEYVLMHPEHGRDMGMKVRVKILDMMDPEMLERHEQDEYDKLLKRHPGKKRPGLLRNA